MWLRVVTAVGARDFCSVFSAGSDKTLSAGASGSG